MIGTILSAAGLLLLIYVIGKLVGRKKKVSKGKKPSRKKKSDVRKIYKTTDGHFTQNDASKKPRRVAVVKQRKDDGAVAVCKIYSKEGKDPKEPRFVQDLTLSPKRHKSLTEDSLVGANVIVGAKDRQTKEYNPLYKGDFAPTKDKLTKKEHRQIMENLGGGNEKHKKTNEELLKKWDNHFKQ